MTQDTKPGNFGGRLVKFAILIALGGLAGFGVGWLFAGRVPEGLLSELRWSDAGALILAAMLIPAGALAAMASGNERVLAAMSKGEGPAGAPERRNMRLQGLVLAGSGLLLATAPVAAIMGNPAPEATFVALMAATFIHSALNYSLWRGGDEMMRRVVVESGAACFWIAQISLFAWAVAERLGLAPALNAWDGLIVLMALYLICSTVVGVRRGLS